MGSELNEQSSSTTDSSEVTEDQDGSYRVRSARSIIDALLEAVVDPHPDLDAVVDIISRHASSGLDAVNQALKPYKIQFGWGEEHAHMDEPGINGFAEPDDGSIYLSARYITSSDEDEYTGANWDELYSLLSHEMIHRAQFERDTRSAGNMHYKSARDAASAYKGSRDDHDAYAAWERDVGLKQRDDYEGDPIEIMAHARNQAEDLLRRYGSGAMDAARKGGDEFWDYVELPDPEGPPARKKRFMKHVVTYLKRMLASGWQGGTPDQRGRWAQDKADTRQKEQKAYQAKLKAHNDWLNNTEEGRAYQAAEDAEYDRRHKAEQAELRARRAEFSRRETAAGRRPLNYR